MDYVQRKAWSPLRPWVERVWYVRDPEVVSRRERVLPTGMSQVIVNLASDACMGCAEDGATFRQAPMLVAGVRPKFALIDSSDMKELMGAVIAPSGMKMFFAEPADRLGGETALEDLWGRAAVDLRDRLRAARGAEEKLVVFERFLLERMLEREPHPAVRMALAEVLRAPDVVTVAGLSRSTGLSSRRLGELFRESVGVGPKTFARIRRFHRAVHCLHEGGEPKWAELALELGYYDQSHFANDFREFSGINPTTYLQSRRTWANHVALESGAAVAESFL